MYNNVAYSAIGGAVAYENEITPNVLPSIGLIRNCQFWNNTDGHGGAAAIYVANGNVMVEVSTIFKNIG